MLNLIYSRLNNYLDMKSLIIAREKEHLGSNTKRNRGEEFEPGGYADCL